jgi:hypothetical protein
VSSLADKTAPVQTDPRMRPLLDLSSLSDFLWESHYMPGEALNILQSAQRHYSVVPAYRAGMLDREDYPIAVAILHEANVFLGPPTDAELASGWPGGDS